MNLSGSEIGMIIFIFFILLATALYIIDQFKRINLSLPFGRTIPYTLAVLGAGIYFFSTEGLFGLFKGIATAIFVGYVMQGVQELKTAS